mmetsp:Transcript_18298/g.8522  ORF Transcript_18298/g.8522 Transcript_18298/m.8522 type:complete len:80 (-) Transcript_18298:3874-4113(-)
MIICETIREGQECSFMTSRGCSYNTGVCHEIVEQCNGCSRIAEFLSGKYCAACPEPVVKWRDGDCNLATHINIIATKKR